MAKSVVDMALDNIEAQIRELVRAKEIIIDASNLGPVEAEKPKRGRKPKAKPGLPAQEGI